MTQLLISVKSVEESLLARYAGVDVIDLKDPSKGALGALDVGTVSQIVAEVKGNALVSATVGEGHASVGSLGDDIKQFAGLGIDVVKISVSELFFQQDFFTGMRKLTTQGIKLVAVFFADKSVDLKLISELQKNGFYGAMLDTQIKTQSLLDVQSTEVLNRFTDLCQKHQLVSGLAGSVNRSHVNRLLQFHPSFIGMRGGVCDGHNRNSDLSKDKVIKVKEVLLNYNTGQGFSEEDACSSLHV